MDRDEAIARIRQALKQRSGRQWSVKGGRGTGWGWIKVCATPARCTWSHRLKAGMPDLAENYEEYDTGAPGHYMSPSDRAELGQLLGFDQPAHLQGVSIAASYDHRREYVDRAEGRTPAVIAQPYWD